MIKTPEENDDSWKKILNGVQEKKGLITSSFENDKEYPCPHTKPLCYATKALKGPNGVIDSLTCVGFPRQEASFMRLELICAAMTQIPNFQTFLKDTKWERGMEGNDIHGIILSALSQKYSPL